MEICVLISHGVAGSPEENWLPWLAAELKALGHQVVVPRYPTPEGQSLTSWKGVLEQHFGSAGLDGQAALVGHSLGSVFHLRLLEQATKPVKASFFVSSFLRKLDIPEFDALNKTFM